MVPLDSFDDVIGRLRAGEEDGAAEVFNRFADRLIRMAKTRLDVRIRQKMDPEDVTQSVFRSFFRRHAEGQFQLDDWGNLWSLLVRITIWKCGRHAVAFRAQRRDVRREIQPDQSSEESRKGWEAMAREPTPAEVAALTDTLDELMRRFTPPEQEMLSLRLQGYTAQEVGERVNRTQRTVFRVMARARERLEKLDRT